jgi:predicted membrane channel-forming protein YqfA (hemolysin III family)
MEGKWHSIARWVLFLSYAVGSPAFAFAEYRTGMFSARFDYAPEFLYLVSATQFACAFLLFRRHLALVSLAILTVLSVGAAASHLKINSPLTALPALAYTVVQVWYGIWLYRRGRHA